MYKYSYMHTHTLIGYEKSLKVKKKVLELLGQAAAEGRGA